MKKRHLMIAIAAVLMAQGASATKKEDALALQLAGESPLFEEAG